MKKYLLYTVFAALITSVQPSFAMVSDQEMELAVNLYNPFTKLPSSVDPLTQHVYKNIVAGPSYRAPKEASFEYYRYVTFYDVVENKERVHSLPIQREECYDESLSFATYSFSYTFASTITAGVSIDGLGLSGSLSDSRTVATTRSLRATPGIIADHIPYFLKQDWVGKTYIQIYRGESNKSSFIGRVTSKSPRWLRMMTPISYPFTFEVKDADWVFAVERNIIGTCK